MGNETREIGDFREFSRAVAANIKQMAKHQLMRADIAGDELWRAYLAAFPAGGNPLFRQRTQHDCSCCRHWIRDVGNVVCWQNGTLVTVWDVINLPWPYQDVADAMAERVRGAKIKGAFFVRDKDLGSEATLEFTASAGVTWHHFFCSVPERYAKGSLGRAIGEAETARSVLRRTVTELKSEAVAQVLELIDQGVVYRGHSYREMVSAFGEMQRLIQQEKDEKAREARIISQCREFGAAIRDTAIGRLIEDISNGMPTERALKSYETITAPQNYQRPTAKITPAMIDEALKTIRHLKLEPALERRHATAADVSVRDVLWSDSAFRPLMRDSLRETLLTAAQKPVARRNQTAAEISFRQFMDEVRQPETTGVDLLFTEAHVPRLMSLTAPVHADAEPLFKWGNGIGWAYNGNFTDSIKQRVKRAGGQVEGVKLRVSLAWNNTDDLDLHASLPSGHRVYYGNKLGILDVDANAFPPLTNTPVENMRWPNSANLPDGVYRFEVHQFNSRESSSVGFTVEIECAGKLTQLSFMDRVKPGEFVKVCHLVIRDGKFHSLMKGDRLLEQAITGEVWGLKPESSVKVNSIVCSPNHWQEETGNKHTFFLLEGCRNPEPVRGIYNEFLRSDLSAHRKVFEVLGGKTMCPVAEDQLSGVGFSEDSAAEAMLLVRRKEGGRIYRVIF